MTAPLRRVASVIPFIGLAVATCFGVAPVRAQSAPAASGPRCVLTGTTAPSTDVEIHDAISGGRAIAHFAGAEIPISESDFPSDASVRRAAIATGDGRGNFHINGFVESAKLPVYTASRVPVFHDHLWIGEGQRVSVVGSDADRLRVVHKVISPIDQTFSATSACSLFTLSFTPSPGWNVPGEARGYVVKKSSIELFDGAAADRNLVTSLHRADGVPGILMWSTERRDDWVHVEYHGEILIDAWARARDLEALDRGETMDQLAGPVYKHSSQRLALAGTPRVVRTTRQISLRIKASDSGPVIGWIEPDTDTYVIDIVAGWASVMPRSLNVVPSGDGQFWVKASDLPGS